MWSRRSTEAARAACRFRRAARALPAAALLALAAGCTLLPHHAQAPAPVAPAEAPQTGSAATTGAAGAPAQPAPPPARAQADFQRAVGMMRAGNTTEAELEFEQIAVSYPQLSAPEVNLGILYRKSDRLDLSEQALRAAVERNAASAPAWNELGVTLRMRGRFKDAAEAYRSAIAADGAYAPAYRNLGVLLDLYLEDPAGALAAFERYKELTGEQKPVSGWIAEVRQRAGKSTPAATAPGTASPGIATPGSPAPSAAPGSAAPGGGQGPARDQTPTPQGKPPAASSAAQPERSGE